MKKPKHDQKFYKAVRDSLRNIRSEVERMSDIMLKELRKDAKILGQQPPSSNSNKFGIEIDCSNPDHNHTDDQVKRVTALLDKVIEEIGSDH